MYFHSFFLYVIIYSLNGGYCLWEKGYGTQGLRRQSRSSATVDIPVGQRRKGLQIMDGCMHMHVCVCVCVCVCMYCMYVGFFSSSFCLSLCLQLAYRQVLLVLNINCAIYQHLKTVCVFIKLRFLALLEKLKELATLGPPSHTVRL